MALMSNKSVDHATSIHSAVPSAGVKAHSLFLPPQKDRKHRLSHEGFFISCTMTISVLYFLRIPLMFQDIIFIWLTV